MKRALALLCAALLALLCFACGEKPVKPEDTPAATALLTLYTDTQPLRIVTQQKGVTVTLQLLEYEPTLQFLRPIADEWEETLLPGKEYEIDKELAEGLPEYRLLVRQGENMALYDLTYMGFEGGTAFELEGKPWAPAPVNEDSPMLHLCRMAAYAPGWETYDYWCAIASAVSLLRAVDLELPPQDDGNGGSCYRLPEWLFDAYAQALFPGVDADTQEEGEAGWVSYHPESNERYWVAETPFYGTWMKYKSAQQNPDGAWDVTITGGDGDGDATWESVIKLAPNEAYNPESPFEYHLVGLPMEPDRNYGMPEGADWDDDDAPNPAKPPPDIVVGTWRAKLGEYDAAYLEIHPDGMAGLYKGDAESDQLYETYGGTVSQDEGDPDVFSMEFLLNWHIYESEDGSPVTGVPDTYSGTYTLRHAWEGGQQVLRVTAGAGALFGRKELKMLWVPKTLGGGSMRDIEAAG